MNRKVSVGATIAVSLIVAAVVFSITMIFSLQIFNSRVRNLSIREQQFNKLAEIDRLVTGKYIGTDSIDKDALLDSLATGYMNGIGDPWATYFSAAETQALNKRYSGTSVGIGIRAKRNEGGNNYIEILEVFPDSPAQAVGLQSGDQILTVDGTDLRSLATYEEAEATLQGDEGTKVTVIFSRSVEGTVEEQTVEMTRRAVEVRTVNYRMIPDTEIGFIQIVSFYENTQRQFSTAVDALVADGAKGLIFDLRGNTGGDVAAVVAMLDKLLPEGLILQVVDLSGTPREYPSDAASVDLPMMVITNESTASASEVFAQALRDFKKGQTVGTKTFGKGVVQQIYSLNDGSSIRVTNARYYTRSGVTIDQVGIVPDFEVKITPEDQKMITNTPFNQLSPELDLQLSKALEIITAQTKGEQVVAIPAAQLPGETALPPTAPATPEENATSVAA